MKGLRLVSFLSILQLSVLVNSQVCEARLNEAGQNVNDPGCNEGKFGPIDASKLHQYQTVIDDLKERGLDGLASEIIEVIRLIALGEDGEQLIQATDDKKHNESDGPFNLIPMPPRKSEEEEHHEEVVEKNDKKDDKEDNSIAPNKPVDPLEELCALDPNDKDVFEGDELNQMFVNITTLPEFQKHNPQVISSPDTMEDGIWLITLEHVFTDEELLYLIETGDEQGFRGYNKYKDKGYRTGGGHYCLGECTKRPLIVSVMDKMEHILGIPKNHSELQLLQYKAGQQFKVHSDYDIHRRMGTRILTYLVYLNEVEAGGGTNFPHNDLTIQPQKGKVVIWPSVKMDALNSNDKRTEHQGLPVEAGIKYALNTRYLMRAQHPDPRCKQHDNLINAAWKKENWKKGKFKN